MDMFGTVRLKTPRDQLWQAFRDSSLMKQCIPGCADFAWIDGDQGVGTAAIEVGPIAAKFKGQLRLFDVEPPVTCTITGEANGGVNGFVTGIARVRLDETAEGTEVSYYAEARFCRRLTKLGLRRVDAAAKELATRFFDALRESVETNARAQPMGRSSSRLG